MGASFDIKCNKAIAKADKRFPRKAGMDRTIRVANDGAIEVIDLPAISESPDKHLQDFKNAKAVIRAYPNTL